MIVLININSRAEDQQAAHFLSLSHARLTSSWIIGTARVRQLGTSVVVKLQILNTGLTFCHTKALMLTNDDLGCFCDRRLRPVSAVSSLAGCFSGLVAFAPVMSDVSGTGLLLLCWWDMMTDQREPSPQRPLLIRWCFVLSARPSLSLLLLSVRPSVCQKSRRFKTKREGTDYSGRPIKLAGKVIIQEISCLLPVHKVLGESYM